MEKEARISMMDETFDNVETREKRILYEKVLDLGSCDVCDRIDTDKRGEKAVLNDSKLIIY